MSARAWQRRRSRRRAMRNGVPVELWQRITRHLAEVERRAKEPQWWVTGMRDGERGWVGPMNWATAHRQAQVRRQLFDWEDVEVRVEEAATCAWCGTYPAVGQASITIGEVERFYCHPDDEHVTCYMRATGFRTSVADLPPL